MNSTTKNIIVIFFVSLMLWFMSSFEIVQNNIYGITNPIVKDTNTVIIGRQEWQTHNLNKKVFNNGDTIFYANSNEKWDSARAIQLPAWCYYNHDSSDVQKYGIMYNWFAVIDQRGLAPIGWKIPSVIDYKILDSALGGNYEGLQRLAKVSEWPWSNRDYNEIGFNALPGGSYFGRFDYKGNAISFWTNSCELFVCKKKKKEAEDFPFKIIDPCIDDGKMMYYIFYFNGDFPFMGATFSLKEGAYVRCLRDTTYVDTLGITN